MTNSEKYNKVFIDNFLIKKDKLKKLKRKILKDMLIYFLKN